MNFVWKLFASIPYEPIGINRGSPESPGVHWNSSEAHQDPLGAHWDSLAALSGILKVLIGIPESLIGNPKKSKS